MSGNEEVRVYCTSYCNNGHRLEDGVPVDHECRVLPPKALEAERQEDIDTWMKVMERLPIKLHKGVWTKKREE